jgi:hypothetical protein
MRDNSCVMIGFGFRARGGKDTSVRTIIDRYSDRYSIKRFALADPMRVELYDALLNPAHEAWSVIPWSWAVKPWNHLADTEYKLRWYEENRAALGKLPQLFGTEYRRTQDSFYWVKKLRAAIESERPDVALVSDVRFLNEFYYVKSQKGFMVQVDRPDFRDCNRDAKHRSECELEGSPFDYTIINDGTLEQLQQDACTVFEHIIASLNPVQELAA